MSFCCCLFVCSSHSNKWYLTMGLFWIFLMLSTLHTHTSVIDAFLRYVSRSSADFKAVSLILLLLDCLHSLLLWISIPHQLNGLQILPLCWCFLFHREAFSSPQNYYTHLLACAWGSHLGNHYENKCHKDLTCFCLVVLYCTSLIFKSLINSESIF